MSFIEIECENGVVIFAPAMHVSLRYDEPLNSLQGWTIDGASFFPKESYESLRDRLAECLR